ncbi:MAG: alpha/beta fold hydrolase [Pseudomonadales bacterium]|nr:alpha/beta fold hydrolase [Pseudomonadales bacterium]
MLAAVRIILGFVGMLFFMLAQGNERSVNNGNLQLQDIPLIPDRVVQDLGRFQNMRSARLLDWNLDGSAIYIQTRFGDVQQIHKVAAPGAARQQLTFYTEPVGRVSRQPQGRELIFTRDAGGSEFSQVFLFDPQTGESRLQSDGESRYGSVLWDAGGRRFAYQSTQRDGKSNDVWMMPKGSPAAARMLFEATDGTWWAPAGFSPAGNQLLLQNYVSVVDSRIHLLNIETGDTQLLFGGPDSGGVNLATGFDQAGKGLFFITDKLGEFAQLAWAEINSPSAMHVITEAINWDVEAMVMSEDGRRGAFIVNENGISQLYLLDTKSLAYRKVTGLPVGSMGKMVFNPNGLALAITINTPQSPSDVYVLALGPEPLAAGEIRRWTYSEVGGLNTNDFIAPELVHYPSFDQRNIPLFVYKPAGEGPFPVIISIHGGPESQALPRFSSTYQMWLAKLGAAVLLPNVRGSAGYGKTYLQSDNGLKREDSVKDIGALLDWVATQPTLDANRVAVYGGSYGGYMALAAAVYYSDRLKAAVDVVGISNFVTFLENTQSYRRDLRRVEYGDERNPAMRAHLEAISPLNLVHKIKIPMFVVQGQNDPRVPVTEAIQMVAALRKQGLPVWYMNALNEGHGYRRKENRDKYQQVNMMFFEKYLLNK